MTKLILSTSNIMGGGPTLIRRFGVEKSNTELTNSLRANFTGAQQAASVPSEPQTNGTTPNGVSHKAKPSYKSWTSQDGSTLYIPHIDFTQSGLQEEHSAYDITVKLFFLPNVPVDRRCSQTREAIELVLKELHVPSIDLLIVSFPGISFDADDEDDDDDYDAAEEGDESGRMPSEESQPDSGHGIEDLETMARTWQALEKLYDEGLVRQLGVSEFGTQRLSNLLAKTRIRPKVNQINVRDCCVVPKPLILFAKKERIELLTHNDCTNILPRGTLRELLGDGEKGAGVLKEDGQDGDGLSGDVEPQWVVKYTAVVKDRGVVENKGYFAVAELNN